MINLNVTKILNCLPKRVDDEILKKIKSIPNFFLSGFCDMDLSQYDFSACNLSPFSNIAFNSKTIFPEKKNLPKGFDINYISKALKKKKLSDDFLIVNAS